MASQLGFGLQRNFTEKDPSSSVKRLFQTRQHDCGVDRTISRMMTSTEKQQLPVSAVVMVTTQRCSENRCIGHLLFKNTPGQLEFCCQ